MKIIQHGFTMTEMVAVMAIVAILMALGVPSYRYVTNSNRMSAEVNGLLGDMQFARSEAIKEGRTVTICVSGDGASCTNSTLWQRGWIVFSDVNNDATRQAATEPVLRVQPPFSGSDTLQDSANTLQSVTFNREGFATGLPAGGATIVVHDLNSNPVWTRCLSISLVGMLTTTTHTKSPAQCT